MASSWAPLLVAFAGGSLTATAISAIVKHLIVNPLISVRLDKKGGSYGRVTLYYRDEKGNFRKDDKGNLIDGEGRYFRLRVENTGLSAIKDCSGFITKLTKHPDTGKEEVEEVIDLGWTSHEQSDTRDIPRGAFFYMDVATLEVWPGRGVLSVRKAPSTLKDFFKDKGTYEFDILIGAGNARPHVRIPVKFKFDPASNVLDHEPLDRSRYPRGLSRFLLNIEKWSLPD